MLSQWVASRLEPLKDQPRLVLRDPLQLLPRDDPGPRGFAAANGFVVIDFATNLVFRQLYEDTVGKPEAGRILLWDRAPTKRRQRSSGSQAAPPFYPDFLALTPPEARIDLSLRAFLIETTGDPLWPKEADEPRYARLIASHLPETIRAHENLRRTRPGQFTDADFQTIVAYASLGVPEAAFRRLEGEALWKVAMLDHEALEQLESLVPDVTRPIKDELRRSPAPFRWFADRDAETVLRAFYLSVILSQHLPNWKLLLANVDPALGDLSDMDESTLKSEAPALATRDPAQMHRDLEAVERSLGKESLDFLLLGQLKVDQPAGFADVIEHEQYSTLFRSLALLMALDNLLSPSPSVRQQKRISEILFPREGVGSSRFSEQRPSAAWPQIRQAYGLATEILDLRGSLLGLSRLVQVKRTEDLSYSLFWEEWNGKRMNRLEYYLSSLERLVASGELLPCPAAELPEAFTRALDRIRSRASAIAAEVQQMIDKVNGKFQEMVAAQYPSWVAGDAEAVLTAQFLRRCLKPYWDPRTERAALFIFDGMRYDIWDELLRPMLVDRMDTVAELKGSSILPSETQLSRKAISAGTFPDQFDSRGAEDRLLKSGLAREFGYSGDVEVPVPEGAGTGETVRYRAGKLDLYILEMCDTELHGLEWRTLPDGRVVPSRPLSYVYERQLKNLIDTEFMAIVRGLEPGTKVFITADHGFGRVGQTRIQINAGDLNEPMDCSYQNCKLRVSPRQATLRRDERANVIGFTPEQLRLPKSEPGVRNGQPYQKQYAGVIFPRLGYAFGRPDARFNPDAYSHGGISMQELMIPMVVLRVKARDEGPLVADQLVGPAEVVEGTTAEFRLRLIASAGATLFDELRVDLEATVSSGSRDPGATDEADRATEASDLPRQVHYVSTQGADALFRVTPQMLEASAAERRAGVMSRVLTVTAVYRDGRRTIRKVRTHRFTVLLNSDVVVRRIGKSLGGLLGLTPKRTG